MVFLKLGVSLWLIFIPVSSLSNCDTILTAFPGKKKCAIPRNSTECFVEIVLTLLRCLHINIVLHFSPATVISREA